MIWGIVMSETWTDERITQLTTLWTAGSSASAIGNLLGVSRNAVIGKAHRLGLEKPVIEKPQQQVAVIMEARRVRHNECKRIRHALMRSAAPPKPKPAPVIVLHPSLNIPLMDLGPNQCRYIAGDDYLACGRPTEGGSWCRHCENIVFYRRAA
jgi:hypothetical protein